MSAITRLPEGDYFTTQRGHRLHYLDQGGGPAVVLLHGSGPGASGHSNFKFNYPWLVEQGYRVIVPDSPGFGRSDKPQDVEYHIDFFVSSLMELLDSLSLEKFSLIGNSLGGAIALNTALGFASRIDKLILMAPGGLEEQAAYFQMPGMQAMREFYLGGETPTAQTMQQVLTNLAWDPVHVTDELVAERLEVFLAQNPQVITTMKVPEITDRLAEIDCPVLTFWGADDRFMPLTGVLKLARGLPDNRIILQSRCGHWFMVEYPELFNRSCADFLSS